MLTAKPLVDLARQASRSIFRTAFYSPHWRIGWRFVEAGDDVWSRGDLGGRPWRVLRNKPFRFFADPFPIACNGKTWLFLKISITASARGASPRSLSVPTGLKATSSR